MTDGDFVTEPFECPVCGFEAESKVELREHFEQKAGDEQHAEYDLGAKQKEYFDEDTQGAPAGTPGHPGIDEGTDA